MRWAAPCLSLILMICVTFSHVSDLYASEESPLVFDSFTITSKGAGGSGKVSVVGSTTEDGMLELNIGAFGKHVALRGEKLKLLRDINSNGLQISIDGGYQDAGGKLLIIVFSTGYSASVVDKLYVIVNEAMEVEVRESLI